MGLQSDAGVETRTGVSFAFSVGLKMIPVTKSISKRTDWLSYVKIVKANLSQY